MGFLMNMESVFFCFYLNDPGLRGGKQNAVNVRTATLFYKKHESEDILKQESLYPPPSKS